MEVIIIRTLQFILSITILVFLHEGGHFLFAKMFGTRVSRFYIFANWKFHLFSSYDNWFRKLIGKPLVTERNDDSVHFVQQVKNLYYQATGRKELVVTENVGNKKYDDKVGTEYGIGWLPIGGYCQIDGMIDETQTAESLSKPAQPWEFRSKKAWQRLLIMAGGVMVNFVLALVIYSAVFYAWGDDYFALKDMTYGMKFNEDAKSYGFKDGDILLSSNTADYRDFSADLLRDMSEATTVNVLRDGKEVAVSLPGDLNLLKMIKTDPVFCRPLVPSVIDSVLAGTPAEQMGLAKGDKICKIGDVDIDSWNALSYELGKMSDALGDAKTRKDSLALATTTFVWQKHDGGAMDTAKVTLNIANGVPEMGVAIPTLRDFYEPTHEDYGLVESISKGVSYALTTLSGYVSDLKYLASADGAKSLGGFGAIGSMFPPVWDWSIFWRMTAFLSIILAFMNIIPIPGLDGGHILFLIIETVTRRQLSLKFIERANTVGFVFILALMIIANLNDVLRWLGIM